MKHIAAILLLALSLGAFAVDSGLGLGPQPVTAGKSADTSAVNGVTLGTTNTTLANVLAGSGSDIRSMPISAGTGITVTGSSSAITLQPKVYLLGSDCSAHSVTGTVSETVLKTYSISANLVPANSVIVVRQLFSFTGSTNSKTFKIRMGAAGAGTGGTSTESLSTATTGNVCLARNWVIYCRGTASQVIQNASSTGEGFSNNSPGTGITVDMTAAWEIAITGTLANTGETITLEASDCELYVP